MKSTSKTKTSKINITITPTHTLVGEEAIPSSQIDHIFVALEDGTTIDLEQILKVGKKVGKKPAKPWKITTKVKRVNSAFKAALKEVQTDMPQPD